jgi:hypothetical protein
LYTQGTLLFFDPFYFKNKNPASKKFFLVVKVIDNSAILACLPTSKIYTPSDIQISHGCLNNTSICINCYVFMAKKPITKCGWYFNFDTLIHGTQLDDFNLEDLKQNYPINGVDYEIIGELTDDELEHVIRCFATSRLVKNKYKKILLSK